MTDLMIPSASRWLLRRVLLDGPDGGGAGLPGTCSSLEFHLRPTSRRPNYVIDRNNPKD